LLADIKNTVKQSTIYGISRIGAKFTSFILIPLYTSIFTAETIANINLLETLWQYLFTICLFAFETSIIAFCAPEKDSKKVKQILFTFFIFLVFNSIVFTVIGTLFSQQIAQLILKDYNLKDAVFYCFLISAFEALLVIPLTIARLNSKAVIYTTISVANLVINLVMQIYFLLKLQKNYDYIFISKFAAPLILVIILLPYVIKYITPVFSPELVKKILKFSFPLMLASLLAMLLNSVDRYILVDFVSKKDVGIYTIGYSIGSIANFFIVSPFVLAFNVISWKKFEAENSNRFFTKSATYLYFFMILFSLSVSFFIPEVIKIFVKNQELWASVNIVRIILLSNCVASLYFVSLQSYYFKKRTVIIFWIFVVCLCFNIAANFILIKYFGIYASAYLSVISYILLLFISYNAARKIYFIKFENYKIILLSVSYMIFTLITIYLTPEDFLFSVILKFVLLITFPFLLYIFKFYEPIEIERIKGFINKYFLKSNQV
jgi:O-antigen/teichoic acid export membrane protein